MSLLAPLAFSILALPTGAAATEWRIDTPYLLANQTYVAEGPVTVAQGGVLTVRNSTILFNLSTEGGITLTVHAGGSLILEDAVLRSNTSGFHYNFLVSGHLEARRADISDVRGDAGLGGIEIDGGNAVIEDSRIHHNRFYGLFLKSGAPVIRRTTLEANVVAISVLPGASPVLEDVVIRNSTSIGLKLSSASPVVRNLTVTDSGAFGIGAFASVLDIAGCEVAGAPVGLDAAQGTRGDVAGCAFSRSGTGVRAQDSALNVTGSTFTELDVGVNLTRSQLGIEGNQFWQVQVGVLAPASGSAAYAGAATGNTFVGTGTAFVIHVPNFFLEDNTYDPRMTGTRVFHEVGVLVVDVEGVPVRNALVDLRDATGALAFSGRTNGTGEVVATLEEFREFGNATRLNLTPYAVRIEGAGIVTETTLNATSDKTEKITLARAQGAPAGAPREFLLLVGVLAGVVAVAGTGALLSRRRKAAAGRAARQEAGRRRRGPRAGR